MIVVDGAQNIVTQSTTIMETEGGPSRLAVVEREAEVPVRRPAQRGSTVGWRRFRPHQPPYTRLKS